MKRYTRPLALLLLLCFCSSLLSCRAADHTPTEQLFWHMDSAFAVRLYGERQAAEEALAKCDTMLAETDQALSITRPNSPLTRWNASQDGSSLPLAPETAALVARALDIGRQCGGAFDITTAPLTALWQSCEDAGELPTDEQMQSTLALVGAHHLTLTDNILEKDDAAVRLDLGGIGKGYALDRLLEYLSAQPAITGALITCGSTVAAWGQKPDGNPWTISLRDPNDPGATVATLYLPANTVLSMSGDYERFFTVGDTQYSHILDPKTGYPPAGDLRAVAVLAEDGALADALSTALMVLGEEQARALQASGTWAFEAVFIYDDHVTTTAGVRPA